MTRDRAVVLDCIWQCVLKIERYSADGKDSFIENEMAQDAIIRNFEVIGEAVKQLDKEFRVKVSDVPWKDLAGFRDVLIHQSVGPGIDVLEVWDAVERDLPELKRNIRRLLDVDPR